ncbi:MAG: toll/interleukin-1 receptor domain-containing protein [Opitutus sp.]
MSYASGDRAAARLLRDTLVDAGLDVWLDEEELVGGEAWDVKIRQQIRTCTYFMPIISATTQARREGYFRREWRLAVERTLDFADDVLFLVPVVIDDTPEQGARVPEKFATVQWLRCPGGRATPALTAFSRRLASTEAPPEASSPAPLSPPSRAERRSERAAQRVSFVPFPAFPADGRYGHFVYELVVWFGHTVRALWLHLPRWLRLVATISIVLQTIGVVFRRGDSAEKRALRENIAKNIATPTPPVPLTKEKILNATGLALDPLQVGRPLALVRFTADDESVSDAALAAFGSLHRQLRAGGHEERVAVSLAPLTGIASDAIALARAATLQCHWLLIGTVYPQPEGKFGLDVKLFDATTGQVIWTDTRSGARTDADAIGVSLADAVQDHVKLDAPKKE